MYTQLTAREAYYGLWREELRVDLGYTTKPLALRSLRNSIRTYCQREDTHPHYVHPHFQLQKLLSSVQPQPSQ